MNNAHNTKISWDKTFMFKNAINISKIDAITSELQQPQSKPTTKEEMESVTPQIHSIYKEDSCDSGIISVFNNVHNKKYKKKSPSQPWFNKKCTVNHKEVFRAKHVYRRINSDCNRNKLTQERFEYRKVIKKAKNEYAAEIHTQLRNLKSTCPKDNWAMAEKLAKLTTDL